MWPQKFNNLKCQNCILLKKNEIGHMTHFNHVCSCYEFFVMLVLCWLANFPEIVNISLFVFRVV